MSHVPTPRDVDEMLNRTVLAEDPVLDAALADSAAAGLPPIEVSPQSAQLLGLLVRIAGARRVLEIGTLGGYSTICLARAVGPGGSVTTLEYELRHADVARRNLERAGVADRVQILVGAALDTLPTVSGEFDLVFIDADKENNVAYVQAAVELGRPGTVIVLDNIIRDGRVLSPADDDLQARAVRDTLEMMGRHPRLDTAAIQTVGIKGWDGFAVALVT
ncbi:O-methyltransferase [Mycolicibacterium tokaiense]|uniref:O-methyl transferase mdmC n=1 Tax=Mycolicibacterium tokaiense TaxID=39695 RepID=A0A378THA1_9MYCO|nr:O-methyltransferase [Mycolicibacterium tokaiense]BBY85312.1 O-methyltransferase [Mycolicibacterium tokaiense]STZ60181.1 O-methyl transferase mdmC [Mycolicibacterium tokaiense]